MSYTLQDLLEVEVDVRMTEEPQRAVFAQTVTQNKCLSWYTFKAVRISASMFKSVCRTSVEKPSLSLIKSFCYAISRTFKTKATEYGLKHEDSARTEYRKIMERDHRNFRVAKAGSVDSQDYLVLGASPDGLTKCNCCPLSCVEIKCPYRMKSPDITMQEFSLVERSFLRREDDGAFKLDREHAYFYQIHLQMHATRTTHCEFVVWSKTHLSVERIYFDSTFLEKQLEKALQFHKHVIMSEVLRKWYTMSKDRRVDKELCCDCGEEDDGDEMILCSNDECKNKWFHEKCVSLPNASSLHWFCRTCSIEIFNI
ncbi:uncharacterized protein LOC117178054 [Belonocnema kinseyi]|uniref:uncharacterized protein LOC117178054 n=1 Tax=Belonocnema kinseyi TaxID=2817044 RepID=UPI00143DFDCE|nr:uncharacterized protein LOC117178054 [Belonocnema kinseyi]XP_033225154.1 uncharacterized protein LOC117178054 [Belonocnema kinseyi]